MCSDRIDPRQPLTFNEDSEREFHRIQRRYPNAQAMVLPALHLAQKQFGYLSETAMEYIAQRLGLSPAKVLGAATFYEMFHRFPVGRCHVKVCVGPSCALMGADRILAFLATRLNIKPGQTTPDRMFTLSQVECLACCGTAPVVMCNDRYYEMVTIASLESLLADWSRQENPLSQEH